MELENDVFVFVVEFVVLGAAAMSLAVTVGSFGCFMLPPPKQL